MLVCIGGVKIGVMVFDFGFKLGIRINDRAWRVPFPILNKTVVELYPTLKG